MLIRLLCAHEMTKHVCKISHLNSKRFLRKLQKLLGGYFILPHPVHNLYGRHHVLRYRPEGAAACRPGWGIVWRPPAYVC